MESGAVGGGDCGWDCDAWVEEEAVEVWVFETVTEDACAEGMVRARKAERKEAKNGRVEEGGWVGIVVLVAKVVVVFVVWLLSRAAISYFELV